MIRIAKSLITIIAVSAIAIGATGAYFSDSEVVAENTFAAGTLDLKVNDADGPVSEKFEVASIAPGYDSGYKVYCLKNTGTVPGQPSVEFSAMINSENGASGPEIEAETESYASSEGELGQYMKYTIGHGPCGWSVPSRVVGQSQTGPVHPWGIPGLNGLSGNTYFGEGGSKFPVLSQGETIGFFIKANISDDIQRWDGTKWLDVNDNIIQSDSLEFDITFHLDQE